MQVAALFAPDVVLRTGSAEVVTTPEGVRRYFRAALDGKRAATKATPFGQTALVLADSIVAISGKRQSERTLDGEMTTAGPWRDTAVMQKRGADWLIVQFHNFTDAEGAGSAADSALAREALTPGPPRRKADTHVIACACLRRVPLA